MVSASDPPFAARGFVTLVTNGMLERRTVSVPASTLPWRPPPTRYWGTRTMLCAGGVAP